MFIVFLLTFLLLFTVPSAAEKPVEAWIAYKQVDGKVVEVVKVRTDDGKVYEFYPGLSPKEIPKPKNRLPEPVLQRVFLLAVGFFLGLLTGVVVLWRKYRKLVGG